MDHILLWGVYRWPIPDEQFLLIATNPLSGNQIDRNFHTLIRLSDEWYNATMEL